ncbi:hypothetical protein CGLAU_01030 [Corynebacterium glaucum]|mgnify:CR=1 FL=1|uniref:Polysaccharide biosynthesis protein n=1 Tax=Corynebacterium glaucum TaxID=187491 RepID=A0A1Q2HTN8_9CORY|nr:hypothetical protein [Corynebacterium glaucum]AQQ14199.1 hypothetical protein CGLAU_01030 [Corynebacterium glaucum]
MRNLSLATLFSALAGFVLVVIAGWALDIETEFRYFSAYWGLFFASAGLIDGITQETTRAVASARETGVKGTASPWRFASVAAAIVVAVGTPVAIVAMHSLVPMSPGMATSLLIFGLVSYTFQAVLSGILSGAQLWNQYASLVALDSGVRLVLALLAWAFGWGLTAFLLITVAGAASWMVILGASDTARTHIRVALDVDRRAFVRRVVSAMLASGASAALITGFPTAVSAAFPDNNADISIVVGAMNNAVILTRAPVLVPLQRFQSALVVRFVEHRDRIYQALLAPVGAVLALGAVGFVAAWAIGPWILKLGFKPELFVDGRTLALLTLASAFMGMLMITGVAVLALEQHVWYVAGWVVASIVAFAVLFTSPWAVATAVVVALYVGPLAGAVVHVAGLARARVEVA